MTTIDTTGKPAYMYDSSTSTWYEISGRVSTAPNYSWTGAHEFNNNTFLKGAVTATLRFNAFLNPTARTSAISSPQTGLISFIQQDDVGNTVNKFQYWNGSAWVDINTVTYSATAPVVGITTGSIWVKADGSYDMYMYNGSQWKQTGGSGSVDPFFLMGA